MKISKSVPTLSVYAPNRTTWLGATRQPLELNFEYNFNGCSTLEFEINKYVYDENRFKWVLNPLYDSIQKRNLIYVAGNDEIYSYKTNELFVPSNANAELAASKDGYGMKLKEQQPAINLKYAQLTYTPQFYNCSLQNETLLFDIGARDGYTWSLHTDIQQQKHNFDAQRVRLHAPSSGFAKNLPPISNVLSRMITAEQFLPIQKGDIIALGSRKQRGGDYYFDIDGVAQYAYIPFFYLSDSEATCSHIGSSTLATDTNAEALDPEVYDPIKRLHVSNSLLESNSQNNGYVRFLAEFLPEQVNPVDGYLMPNFGYVKIFSGERRLQSLSVQSPKQLIRHGVPWWVITEVSDSKQGMNSKKIVKAYSYEYTLSQRNTSLSESTLPLYVPDVVVDTVRSRNFICARYGITRADEGGGSTTEYTTEYGAQRMERGLMNQILDALPGWSIRYLSQGLATKYRNVPEVDNENIYSFLMNTVQKLYNCYFIFDTENMRINILSHDDFLSLANNIGASSGAILSWRNVLKEINVSETDDSFLTSCRVYSDDSTYGVGLVNPNATDNICNFQSILPLLEYAVDESHINPSTNAPYTLRELCELYMQEYNAEWINIKQGLSAAAARYDGVVHDEDPIRWKLILAINELPKLQAKQSEALARFQVSVSENNIVANVPEELNKVPPIPMPINEYGLQTGFWSYYWWSPTTGTTEPRRCWAGSSDSPKNLAYFYSVRDAATGYWEYADQLESLQNQINSYLSSIKASAMRYSLDARALQPLFDANNVDGVPTAGYTPIFTPREAAEMAKYIYEGTWTNDKIVFTEEYSPTDIVNTLVDFMDTAKSEMDTLYSKPQYEFDVDFADLPRHSLLGKASESLYLGNALTIDDGEERANPILLQVKVSYGSDEKTEMGFSTNYKRKPLETRFSEMFATINQVSVTSPQYTYEG